MRENEDLSRNSSYSRGERGKKRGEMWVWAFSSRGVAPLFSPERGFEAANAIFVGEK